MANSEDVERAKRGRGVWNHWATVEIAAGRKPEADFSNAQMDVANFSQFVFPGPAWFQNTIFPRTPNFTRAKFFGQTRFEGAVFPGGAQFQYSEFSINSNFDDATFTGDVSFHKAKFFEAVSFNTTFPSNANFSDVEVHHNALFNRAIFEGAALFDLAKFFDGAFFDRAKFLGGTSFNEATFRGSAYFGEANFQGGKNDFIGAEFASVPDLRAIRFEVPLNLNGTKIPYRKTKKGGIWRRLLSCADGPEDVACYRRLKELAAGSKDHERELAFFAFELRAKRFYETTEWLAIALNVAYGLLSDYGRSILRPVAWLIGTTALSIATIAYSNWSWADGLWQRLIAFAVLAVTNATLLVGSDRWLLRAEAFKKIGFNSDQRSFSLAGESLAYAQSAFSLLMLFLIGLALRNRFRIGGGG